MIVRPRVTLCRSGCCPQLAFTDDGQVGAITADRAEDDVYVDDGTVTIRFNRDQLQVLANTLAENGIVAEKKGGEKED